MDEFSGRYQTAGHTGKGDALAAGRLISVDLLTDMLRKALPFFFFLLFLFNCTGAGLLSLFLINEHRGHLHETEKTHRAITISISPNLLHGKEFVLNGKRYDVLRVSSANGQLLITCIPDTEEDELLAGLDENTGGSSLPSKQKNNAPKKFTPEYLPAAMIRFSLLSHSAFPSETPVAGLQRTYHTPLVPPPWING